MKNDQNRRRVRRRSRRRTPYMRATAVVLNPDNDVLLVQHNGQDDWALPGGRIVVGEDPAHRAAIEVEEETGIHITHPMRVGHHAGTTAAHEIYVAQGSGEPRPNHREIQDAIWWDGVRPLRIQPHVCRYPGDCSEHRLTTTRRQSLTFSRHRALPVRTRRKNYL